MSRASLPVPVGGTDAHHPSSPAVPPLPRPALPHAGGNVIPRVHPAPPPDMGRCRAGVRAMEGPGCGTPAVLAGWFAVVVLRREVDVPWMPVPNEVSLVAAAELPGGAETTAAFVFAFQGERLLFADLVRRGLEIPGGHVEPGESPAEAARREVLEEAGARLGPLRLVAFQRHRVLAPRPPDYRLPYPDSHMAFFVARVTGLEEVTPDGETAGRALLGPAQACATPWVQRHRLLYEEAVRIAADACTAP